MLGFPTTTDPDCNVLSLGAGRQSTAMALMAAHGDITPMPDVAIFADTGDEPAWVYETVRWLAGDNVLPFSVVVAARGKLSEELLSGEPMARAPYHIKGGGMVDRQCTRNFKIRPIRRHIREFLGVGPHAKLRPGAVSQWIGISGDEVMRMKPSGAQYLVNRWPLIEAGLTVNDCEQWLRRHDYPVPWSSACVHCPLIKDLDRQLIKEQDPTGHARACAIDRELRTPENQARFRAEVYVHRSCQPLDEIDFRTSNGDQWDLFTNECEGMCGV